MFLVGLTGGIGSGKSTVANLLKAHVPVIDADKIARDVVEPGKPAWKKIKQHFGDDVLTETGELNRERLADVVFSDEEKRRLLNSITHPEIHKAIAWKVVGCFLRGCQFAVLDIPLLFESKRMLRYLKFTVVVSCDEEQQVKRIMGRNDFTEEQVLARIRAQLPLAEKVKMADFVIDNSGSLEETEVQVTELYEHFSGLKFHWTIRLVIVFAGVSMMALTFWWGSKLQKIRQDYLVVNA